IGNSVPQVYAEAASLAERVRTLKQTRIALVARRAEAVKNAKALGGAEKELDQLLAIRQKEADDASIVYGDLQAKLDAVAGKAKDLTVLMARVASLRTVPGGGGVVVVGPENGSA